MFVLIIFVTRIVVSVSSSSFDNTSDDCEFLSEDGTCIYCQSTFENCDTCYKESLFSDDEAP